jgi:hypothetical protein
MLFRPGGQNNYIKQLFYFLEGANIRIFPNTPIFFFVAASQTATNIYQLDLVRPGINPKSTISRKVTLLIPKSRM